MPTPQSRHTHHGPTPPRLAFGVTAVADRPGMDRMGREIERLGYDELWSNDTRHGSGIAALDAASRDVARLRLGVGVIALSEVEPGEIVERVRRSAVALDRLTLGVGSGSSRSLELVRRGIVALREDLPGVAIGAAAVGPRMCRLAGETADAVILNWALPDRLAWAGERVAEGATAARRARPRSVAYVRVAIGPGAVERLRREMDRYARFAPHYARAFAEHAGIPVGVALEHPDPPDLAAALAPYRSVVDTVVVRGLPADDDVEAWLEIARLAAPAAGG